MKFSTEFFPRNWGCYFLTVGSFPGDGLFIRFGNISTSGTRPIFTISFALFGSFYSWYLNIFRVAKYPWPG